MWLFVLLLSAGALGYGMFRLLKCAFPDRREP